MLIILFLLLCCGEQARSQGSSRESTEQLSARVCGTCHAVPSPDLLDKTTWRDVVLPRMGTFLGIYPKGTTRESLIETGAAYDVIISHNIYPKKPTIDSKTWKKVRDYYVQNAPNNLPALPFLPVSVTSRFKAVRPAFSLQPPSTTFVDIHSGKDVVRIGDAMSGKIYTLDRRLSLLKVDSTGEAPVWVTPLEDVCIATVMGSFSPTDAPSGKVVTVRSDSTRAIVDQITGLQRPVHHTIGDFDSDGYGDIVVCEFGKWTGGLSWWRFPPGAKRFEPYYRYEGPGATRAVTVDWNKDGREDVLALFAQGNENITAFINTGQGTFEAETVLQFPPSWGSSYFGLQDVDSDGDYDIIHCAGDNADFGPLLRPYHGVRIFLNNGKNAFNDTLFLPLHGAYSASVQDFDLDGDMDVAAISFFPNYAEEPVRGFAYFENTGSGSFSMSTFPEVGSGRWIVMDAGDIDDDGDLDLILGSLVMEVKGRNDLVDQWVKNAIPFVILENLTR
jgi:hypothetical protein